MKLLKITAAVAALSVLSGCATIVGDKEQTVTITSQPTDAALTITDEKGTEVHNGSTPATVQLRKADGSYFGGKSYTVELSKVGYENRTLMIESTPNGWYVGGNLLFGGFIGWLIVDPLTGAMYNLTPDNIDATLGEAVTSTENGDSEITLVMAQDVPEHLQDKMEYLGTI